MHFRLIIIIGLIKQETKCNARRSVDFMPSEGEGRGRKGRLALAVIQMTDGVAGSVSESRTEGRSSARLTGAV